MEILSKFRFETAITTCNKFFSIDSTEVKFIGSRELLVLYRAKRNGIAKLKVKKSFQCGKDFVVLAGLSEYYTFVSDSENKLKRFFFDDNVRD